MSTLAQDLRFALRSLLTRPAFTAVAVLSLALGIGANTAIFSVVYAVLLRPLPYAQPDRLVDVYETIPQSEYGRVSPANFLDWRQQNHVFSQLAAYQSTDLDLQGVGSPQHLEATEASGNLFRVLGAAPLLGRTFITEDDQSGAPQVAVVSHKLWTDRFGADPRLVGKAITLDGEVYTVIGIMPADFHFPVTGTTDIWIPSRWSPQQAARRGSHVLAVVGRLAPGVTLSAAQGEMRQIAARIRAQYPKYQAGRGVRVRPLRQDMTGDIRPTLLVLLGAAGLVLLIACANVANLLLARAAERRREVAIRLALGAGRARLIRQFLTESVLLALIGAAVGLGLAYAGVRALVHLAGATFPFARQVGFDPTVFAFLLLVAVATGIVFGIAPALQTTRVDLQTDLKEGAGKGSEGRGSLRIRSLLVIGETALALLLLVGAGLLMRTFLRLQNVNTGMVTHNVVTMQLTARGPKYDTTSSTAFYQPVLQRVSALPGVRAAGIISLLPLQHSYTNGSFEIEGRPPEKPGSEPFAEKRTVSPGYFGALGIPLTRGRMLSDQDGPKSPIALLVNEALARRYFPGQSPIGRRIRASDTSWAVIVGVVGDVRESRLDTPSTPTIYVSPLQQPRSEMTLVVSTAVPPASLFPAIRRAVWSVDPDQAIYDVETMDQVVARSVSDRSLYLTLLGIFAAVALALAAAGLYGVMSYVVAQRTREIGIRMALGARSSTVRQLIVRQAMTLVLAGLGIGAVAALAMTRVLRTLLYGVSATDPVTFATVALLLSAVALIASVVPAHRAATVDPTVSLKAE